MLFQKICLIYAENVKELVLGMLIWVLFCSWLTTHVSTHEDVVVHSPQGLFYMVNHLVSFTYMTCVIQIMQLLQAQTLQL